jgi:glycosyltransferase involved in cell wall biosynthesis
VRILLIAFYFPPYNSAGGVRTGKLAKHWHRLGHDVRVISGSPQALPPTLPLEIPGDKVIYTSWLNVNRLPEMAMGGRERVAERGFGGKGSMLGSLGKFYKGVFNFPDGQIGWYPFLMQAAGKLLTTWTPDFIYASGLPFTGLIAADRLSRRSGTPWFGELRDLWTDSHYYNWPPLRRSVERAVELRTLNSASGLVTVSEPLAESLRRFGKPLAVIPNGFDPEDVPSGAGPCRTGGSLNLVYTGMIYPGHQDPSPLFRAMLQLRQRLSVRVQFFGRNNETAFAAAKQAGVADMVQMCPSIPYRDSLSMQRSADALLLLSWNDPANKGVYTGKLFEYFGARRPILAVGTCKDVATRLIEERNAGLATNDPAAIANWLEHLAAQKASLGGIPDLPDSTVRGLSRTEQFDQLDQFIAACLQQQQQPQPQPQPQQR